MLHEMFAESLADWLENPPPTFGPEVWPSAITKCPRAHAHERRQDPPVHPYLKEFGPSTRLLFKQALDAEKRWFEILSQRYPCQKQVRICQAGVNGRIDILALMGQTLVPIEVKYTVRRNPAHAWQLAAYLYAGDYSEGYLLLDHGDGDCDSIHLLLSHDNIFYGLEADGRPLAYNGKVFELSYWDVSRRIDEHNQAFANPEAATLPLPVLGQCLRSQEDRLVPACPYFCWGDTRLAFDPIWNEGRLSIALNGTETPVAGSLRD